MIQKYQTELPVWQITKNQKQISYRLSERQVNDVNTIDKNAAGSKPGR